MFERKPKGALRAAGLFAACMLALGAVAAEVYDELTPTSGGRVGICP